VSPADQVSTLINRLTKDEDLRQDLWVHYLSGHSPSTLASYLDKINAELAADEAIREHIWCALNEHNLDRFSYLLSQLSETEQSVACLLALGLTISQLSGYKGISEIRIRQVIAVMEDNDCWEELYAEEKTNRRRASRSK
jgi:hypothetical protein